MMDKKSIKTCFRKGLCLALAFLMGFGGPVFAQSLPVLPPAGQMIRLSAKAEPALMVGLQFNPQDPFRFQFVIDRGEKPLSEEEKQKEYQKLVKYFLASLTIPNEDMWVNLSPYEADRIIPENFSRTEMGRDLLGQDYILKQITSSLVYPKDEIGRKFWDKIYREAYARYGTIDVPVDTFNKVWIVPDRASVYQNGGMALAVDYHLKVMLEGDYLAMSRASGTQDHPAKVAGKGELAKPIIREVILPALEREVNEGANFVTLRQIYSAMLMATWFKKTLKKDLLSQIYVDRSRVAGIEQGDPLDNGKIYQQYLDAYKKGVFDFIDEEYDPQTSAMVPRKYFSGGAKTFDPSMLKEADRAQAEDFLARQGGELDSVTVDLLKKANETPSAYSDFAQRTRMSHEEVLDLAWGKGWRLTDRFIRQVNARTGRRFTAKDGHTYQMEARKFHERPDRVSFYLSRVDQPGRYWEDVLFFSPDEKGGVYDVGVYTNGKAGRDRHESLEGLGIGQWLLSHLVAVMPEEGTFEILVENERSREFLAKSVYFHAGPDGSDELYFKDPRDKNGPGLRVVDFGSGPGTISAEQVLLKTLIGDRLLARSGLTDFVLEIYDLHALDQKKFGLAVLEDMRRVYEDSGRLLYPQVSARKPKDWEAIHSLSDAAMSFSGGSSFDVSDMDNLWARYYSRAFEAEIQDNQGDKYVLIPVPRGDKVFVTLKRKGDHPVYFPSVFIFEAGMAGVHDLKVSLDSKIFSEDLSHRSLGTQLYSILGRAMPLGTMLSQLVVNIHDREYLSRHCELRDGHVYFKEADGPALEVVDSESGPGQISVGDLVAKTIMGKMLVLAGLSSLDIRSIDGRGTAALRQMLRFVQISSDHTAPPYYMEARKLFPTPDRTKDFSQADKGGIDLNAELFELDVQEDGAGMGVSFDGGDLKALEGVAGFEPLIVDIRPVERLSLSPGGV